MKLCIRCNPVQELRETADGLRCPFHDDRYVLEVREDAPADVAAPQEAPAEDVAQ